MLGIIISEETHTFLSIWKLRAKVNSVKFSWMHCSSVSSIIEEERFSLTQQEVKLPVSVEINGCWAA